MKRIKNLDIYQKAILIIMIVMPLIFAVIYPKTIAKVGYRYNDAILVPFQEDGNTVYSGKIKGEPARFVVSKDKTVDFHYGEKSYGPYNLKEDSSAIPAEEELADEMTGIEIYNGNELLFRGGVLDFGNQVYLFREDGSLESIGISYITSDGIEVDEYGNEINPIEPTASTIYELLNEPTLTHKGDALAWFAAAFVCIMNGVSILFADELFRFNLAFTIRNVEKVEPSEWAIFGRYISWTALTFAALILFIVGLK